MSDIRELLDRKAGRFEPAPSGWDRMQRLAGRRQRNRRIGAALVAAIVFVGGGSALWAAFSSGRTGPRPAIPTPSPSPSSSPSAAVTGSFGLTTLRMFSPSVGWATSRDTDTYKARILRTTDGGSTWADLTPSAIHGDDSGVVGTFLDATHAWVAWPHYRSGGPTTVTVFATADGGRSWKTSRFTSARGWDGHLQFIDPVHGWAVATIAAATGHDPQEVWRTVDGGATWTSVSLSSDPYIPNLPPPTAHALPPCPADATFVDTGTGYAISLCNWGTQLFATHDAGQTWFTVSISPPFPAEGGPGAPVFTSPLDGFIPLFAPQGQGGTGAYVTHDGGRTWTLLRLPAKTIGAGPVFSDSRHGWFFTRNQVYVTTDGGLHWSSFTSNFTLDGMTLEFVDPTHGWAFSGDPEHPSLLRTDDGGRTWTQLNPLMQR